MTIVVSLCPPYGDPDNILIHALVDPVEQRGCVCIRNAVGDGTLPLQCSHGHVLNHRTPTGLIAVITGEEHLEPVAVGWQEIQRYRGSAVVPLPDKRAMWTAEGDSRVDALGKAGAFKHRISPIRGDLFHCGRHIVFRAVDDVVRAHLKGDVQLFLVDVHGDHHTSAVGAGRRRPCRA